MPSTPAKGTWREQKEDADAGASRRTYERVEKKVNVRYKLLDDKHKRPMEEWSPLARTGEEEVWHETTTKDISGGGLLFYSDTSIPKGTIVEMVIDLPDSGRPIECLTRVERVEEIKKDSVYGIGVCFLDMSRVDRSRVDKYIKV